MIVFRKIQQVSENTIDTFYKKYIYIYVSR